MKKSLFALAALGVFASAAQAQSSVTLYGILDVAVGSVTKSYSGDPAFPATINPVSLNSATGSTTGMFNGGISGSRWGMKGSEDLGGGMNAIFNLESALNVPTGQLSNAQQSLSNNGASGAVLPFTANANSAIDGQLFSRAANVGLSGSFGTVLLGRSTTHQFEQTAAYDPVQAAQLFSPLGFSGTIGGGGGASENSRLDNSVKYTYTNDGLLVGAQYKFGGIAGSTTAGSAVGGVIGYEKDMFGVRASYLSSTDTVIASTDAYNNGGLATTVYNTTAYMLSGKFKPTNDSTLKAGYEHYTLSAPNAGDLGFAATAGPTNVQTLAYFSTTSASALYTGGDQNVNVYWFGGDYNATPQLNLAAGYYYINYDSFSKTTSSSATVYPIGSYNISAFSLLADYSFSKRTDVYAGAMILSYGGDSCYVNATGPKTATTNCTGSSMIGSATPNTNNAIYAVGIRHKF